MRTRNAPGRPSIWLLLYVLDTYPALSETFIFNEVRELRRRDVPVQVVALARPERPATHGGSAEEAESTTYLGDLSVWRRLGYAVRAMARPRRVLQELQAARHRSPAQGWAARHALTLAGIVSASRCGHVHAHFAGPAALLALPAARMAGRPFTVTTHGYDVLRGPMENLGAFIDATDGCIAVSRKMRDELVEVHGADPSRIVVRTCGVNTDDFASAPDGESVSGRILTVARLSPEKNLQMAVRAAALLRERGIAFEWQIIGDGAERESIEASISEHHLASHMRLLGNQPTEVVRKAMREAQVVVLCSRSEGAGLCLVEAMASARPVVATAVGGVPEVVEDGVTGFLVAADDAEVMADRIARLLVDAPLRRRFGAAGRQRAVSGFSLDAQIGTLLDLVRQASRCGERS